MPPVALSHSVNSSGRMGLYVDSASCPCGGCRSYRGDMPLWDAADAHLFTGPGLSNVGQDAAPAPSPAPLPVRSNGGGITDGSALVMASGGAGVSVSTSSGGLARTVTGLGYEPSSVEEADGGDAEPSLLPRGGRATTSIFSPAPLRTDVDGLMDQLRGLRAELQIQQDHVYDEGLARSHDEMAAQDAQFDEMDRQIHAIEQVMLSFGAIFRTR